MADTLRETVTVNQVSPGVFRSQPFFERARAGNALPIAFGGLALCQAVSAAFQTLPSGPHSVEYHLFSVQGSYLSPASTDLPTTFHVQDVRTTRTMVTRVVIASQDIPPKPSSSECKSNDEPTINDPQIPVPAQKSSPPKATSRKVLIMIADFHRPEPPFLQYSHPPLYPSQYPSPETLPTTEESTNSLLSHNPKLLEVFTKQFNLPRRMFEYRPIPSSMGVENVLGFLDVPTKQDKEGITRRTNTNWIKAKEELGGYAERCAAVAFIMDTALSFLPLVFTSIPLTIARAASSLDFSLRFFSPVKIDTDWWLHEQNTEHADDGRSFSVGRLFDQKSGKEVARMSQISILRGPNEGDLPKGFLERDGGLRGREGAKL